MILTNIKEPDVSQLSVLACLINDFIWECNTFMQVIMWMEPSEIIYILVIIRAVWFFYIFVYGSYHKWKVRFQALCSF